jgi:hypothetical protein
MNKFEIKQLDNKKYVVNMVQENDGNIIVNGLSYDKQELYELYIKLREIFTNNEK